MSSKELFNIALSGPTPGSVIVSQPADRVYLLSFEHAPDNRLTTFLNDAILLALDIIEHRFPIGCVVTTSSITKFYSNGMDLDHVAATPGFFEKSFYPLFRRLSTYPMPTVAWINGHAFAGGLILAMHQDYRLQNPKKGYISMPEIHFGGLMQPPMLSIFREKVVNPNTFRDMILEGKRYTAQEAEKEGLIDGVAESVDDVVKFIQSRELVKKGESDIYGRMKEDMYRQTIGYLESDSGNQQWRRLVELDKKDRGEKAEKRIKEWEQKNGKAKL